MACKVFVLLTIWCRGDIFLDQRECRFNASLHICATNFGPFCNLTHGPIRQKRPHSRQYELPDCASLRTLAHDHECISLYASPVGGMAQWLGRRFLAGGLSLIYA